MVREPFAQHSSLGRSACNRVEGNTGVTVSVSPCAMTAPSSATAGENEQAGDRCCGRQAMLASLQRGAACALCHAARPRPRSGSVAGACGPADARHRSMWVFIPNGWFAPENLDICRATDYLFAEREGSGPVGRRPDAIGLSFLRAQNGLRRPIVKRVRAGRP